MEIHNFQGDFTNISAETKTLVARDDSVLKSELLPPLPEDKSDVRCDKGFFRKTLENVGFLLGGAERS